MDKDDNQTAEMIDTLPYYQDHFVPITSDGDPIPTILYWDGLSCKRAHDAQNHGSMVLQPPVTLRVFILQFKSGIHI